MAYYAWTIKYPRRQEIQKLSTIEDLEDVLRILHLPGLAAAELVTIGVEESVQGIYTHNEGADDEWSRSWTKVDEPS